MKDQCKLSLTYTANSHKYFLPLKYNGLLEPKLKYNSTAEIISKLLKTILNINYKSSLDSSLSRF